MESIGKWEEYSCLTWLYWAMSCCFSTTSSYKEENTGGIRIINTTIIASQK